VRGRTLVLRSPDGGTTVLQPARVPSAFEVGQKRELPVASGDWLLLQANGHGFTNGERVQVKALGRGGIALADGRTLPLHREFQTAMKAAYPQLKEYTSFHLEGVEAEKYRALAGEGLFRLSVGLEDASDIIADLDAALAP